MDVIVISFGIEEDEGSSVAKVWMFSVEISKGVETHTTGKGGLNLPTAYDSAINLAFVGFFVPLDEQFSCLIV